MDHLRTGFLALSPSFGYARLRPAGEVPRAARHFGERVPAVS